VQELTLEIDGHKSHHAPRPPHFLPFDHHDIRVYIDNLFIEGLLHPVPHEHASSLSKTWVGIGVRTAPLEDRSRRLGKLIESMETSIPSEDAKHTDWFLFARKWAEVKVMRHELWEMSERKTAVEYLVHLEKTVDERFLSWIQRRFAGLIQLPPNPPVMVHHIPRFLANSLLSSHHSSPRAKLALVVLDGLALDQWLVVREALASKNPGLRFREQAVFAWIPSLTSVSRQAIFAGKAPLFSRTASIPQTRNPLSGRSSGRIRALRRTRSFISRAWATAIWKLFPKRFLIPRQGSPG